MTSAFLVVALMALAFVAIIAATNFLNNTKWWLCPRCYRRFNQYGEYHQHIPMTGQVQRTGRCCPDCHKANRYLL